MMARHSSWALAAALLGAASVRAGNPEGTFYVNDFAARTSAGPIPTGEWMAMPYQPDTLLFRNNINDTTALQLYLEDAANGTAQDGWVRAFNSNRLYGWCRTNEAGNAYAALGETISTHGYMRNSLHNTFTDGVVRVTADMRPPAKWNGSIAAMYVYCGDRTFFSPWPKDSQAFYPYHAGSFGFVNAGNTTGTGSYFRANGGDGTGTGDGVLRTAVGVEAGCWYRFVADYDLDNSQLTVNVYNLGTEQPAMGTACPATPAATLAAVPFFRNQAHGLEGISSFSLTAFGPGGTYYCTNALYAACYDNLTFAHKAPGASDFTACYQNDFTTRRLRQIAPAGTDLALYANPARTVTNVFTSYPVGYLTNDTLHVLIPSSVAPKHNSQPCGVDGWRRLNGDGLGAGVVVALDGNLTLRMSGAGTGTPFLFAGQPFGTVYSNGTVTVQADIRMPDTWHWSVFPFIGLALGGDGFYNGSHDTFGNHYVAWAGVSGSGSSFYPAHYANGNNPIVDDASATAAATSWCRVRVIVDFNTKTYTYALYAMGTTAPGVEDADGTQLYASGAIVWVNQESALTSFALFSYSGGEVSTTSNDQPVYFDNVKVTAQPAGASEAKLLYQNTFDSRLCIQEKRQAELLGFIDRPGLDDWRRNNTGLAAVTVEGDSPRRLRFSSEAGYDYAYAVQPVGTAVRSGKFCCQVDIRPTADWFWWGMVNGVQCSLGDSLLWQGNLKSGETFFSRHRALAFGFAFDYSNGTLSIMAAKGTAGDGTAATETSSATVDATHWYRFVATCSLTSKTSSVTVYDMGSAQPALDASGTQVASFSGLPFILNPGQAGDASLLDGISTVSLAAFGMRGGGLAAESENVYMANLRCWRVEEGTRYILR